jgi:hypothetical protein
VVLGVIAWGSRTQQSPHLGRDGQSGVRHAHDGLAHAPLGQAVSVQGRGIDVAHAARQRATDHFDGVGVAHRLQEVPQGGCSQADSRSEEIGVADPRRRRVCDHGSRSPPVGRRVGGLSPGLSSTRAVHSH